MQRAHTHAHICTHMHSCTHADMHMQRALAHAHCCHIKFLLNPGVQIPHRSCKIPMSEIVSQWSTLVEEIPLQELSDSSQVEEVPDIVEEVVAHVQVCGAELGGVLRKVHKHIKCIGVLKAQKDQTMKQARHWQAACQKERAKHMKLLENYDKLMEENNEYKV